MRPDMYEHRIEELKTSYSAVTALAVAVGLIAVAMLGLNAVL